MLVGGEKRNRERRIRRTSVSRNRIGRERSTMRNWVGRERRIKTWKREKVEVIL